MTKQTRTVIIVLSIVGFVFLLGLAAVVGVVFYAIQHNAARNTLVQKTIEINLTNPEALQARPYYDPQMGCRIRLPKGYEVEYKTIPDIERIYYAQQPGVAIGVSIMNRGLISFNDYVRANKSTILRTIKNVTLEDEGTTTIDGHAAYVLVFSFDQDTLRLRDRQVYIDGPGTKAYLIMGEAVVSAWPTVESTLDSSLATFEIGTWEEAPAPTLRTSSYRRTIPDPSATPSIPIPPTPSMAAPVPPVSSTPSMTEILVKLDSVSAAEQIWALQSLLRLKPDADYRPTVVSKLLLMSDDPDGTVRALSARGLTIWVNPASEKELLAKFRKASPQVRHNLIPAVGALKTAGAAEVLALQLTEQPERLTAMQTLIQMGPVAEPAVCTLLSTSTDRDVRRKACLILQSIGTSASLPTLNALAKDPDPLLRQTTQVTATVIRSHGH